MSTTHEEGSHAVSKTLLCAIAIAATIAFRPAGANAQASLNQGQAVLYLACIGAGTVGNLPINLPPNVYAGAILTNQQVVSQAQSIASLQGLSFVQLGQLVKPTITDYGMQKGLCVKKCFDSVLRSFLTQNPTSCLSIASGFTP
jgi:hypothetical protein